MGMRIYPITNSREDMEILADVPRGTDLVLRRVESTPTDLLFAENVQHYLRNHANPQEAFSFLSGQMDVDQDYVRHDIMQTCYPYAFKLNNFDSFGWFKPKDACYEFLKQLEAAGLEEIDLEHGLGSVKDRRNILRVLELQGVFVNQYMFDKITMLQLS